MVTLCQYLTGGSDDDKVRFVVVEREPKSTVGGFIRGMKTGGRGSQFCYYRRPGRPNGRHLPGGPRTSRIVLGYLAFSRYRTKRRHPVYSKITGRGLSSSFVTGLPRNDSYLFCSKKVNLGCPQRSNESQFSLQEFYNCSGECQTIDSGGTGAEDDDRRYK